MTELVLDRALHEQYNISIEGTFRTAEVYNTPQKLDQKIVVNKIE